MSGMDILTAINNRSSVRRFSEKVPDRETLETLLKAATRAPSAGNLQPWHFYVVINLAVRESLSIAALSQRHISSAPVVVVVCADPEKSARRYGRRGEDLYCIQDAAVAAENLLLAATGLELGACWVGAFDESQVSRILDAPPGRRPMALIPIGYPAKPPRASSRLELEETVTFVE